MDQPTFADLGYRGKKRKTRRDLFLERLGGLIPWQLLEDPIRPFYPKAGKGKTSLHAVRHAESPLRPTLL